MRRFIDEKLDSSYLANFIYGASIPIIIATIFGAIGALMKVFEEGISAYNFEVGFIFAFKVGLFLSFLGILETIIYLLIKRNLWAFKLMQILGFMFFWYVCWNVLKLMP